jgi:hypothetical protein
LAIPSLLIFTYAVKYLSWLQTCNDLKYVDSAIFHEFVFKLIAPRQRVSQSLTVSLASAPAGNDDMAHDEANRLHQVGRRSEITLRLCLDV